MEEKDLLSGCFSDVAVRPGQTLMQTSRKLKALTLSAVVLLVLLGGVASTLLVFSDVTMGDLDNNGGVISKHSDGVGAVGDVPCHKVIAWDLPVRKFNIQSQRLQLTQVPRASS